MSTNIHGKFDFNGIPFSIIKSVEIGQSDDVGDVSTAINIVTNQTSTGIETNAYYGTSSRGDAETQNYNISIGQKNEKASIFLTQNSPRTLPYTLVTEIFQHFQDMQQEIILVAMQPHKEVLYCLLKIQAS